MMTYSAIWFRAPARLPRSYRRKVWEQD